MLLEFLDQNDSRYLDEVMEWLEHNACISHSALSDILREVGYTYKLLCRRDVERNQAQQEAFRNIQRLHLTARMCVCVDESSKDDRTIYRHYGW
ncbi:hypothetical protein AURDEDRAFT_166196, partial [Auricularia subglabra TFB-10046 SS5]